MIQRLPWSSRWGRWSLRARDPKTTQGRHCASTPISSRNLVSTSDFGIQTQNIIDDCNDKFPIRLEGLSYSHGQFSSYEQLSILMLGKIVLTGAKVGANFFHGSISIGWHEHPSQLHPCQVREEIYTAFNTIYTVLCESCKPWVFATSQHPVWIPFIAISRRLTYVRCCWWCLVSISCVNVVAFATFSGSWPQQHTYSMRK